MASFDYLLRRLEQLRERQRLRKLVPRVADGVFLIEEDGRRLINFGGNDYLGLASERPSSPEFPTGSGASALVCGWTPCHQQLADRIADFESTEAAVVFPTGLAACSGTIATLAEEGDLILSDEINHASLIDGCRLSRAECVVYPHRDCAMVQRTLQQRRGQFHRAWIVTDGVFSMDGHVAPLQELCDIADAYDAGLIVDEAHGTGVLGETGSGLCEVLGVKHRVPLRIGTLSKAIGCQGGFVAGPRIVIDYLINRCRTLIYSTSLAPAAVGAAISALTAIREQPDRRRQVHALARGLRQHLSIEADPVEASIPIIPVLIGEDSAAIRASVQLAEQGFYVPAIRPPTVAEGTARLRVSLSAAHDQAMISSLAEAIVRI